MDKCMENGGINNRISLRSNSVGYIHMVICGFLESFPLIFDEKRYKLINFAPKTESVDN